MTDIGASIGIEALKNFNKILNHRKRIFKIYLNELSKNKNIVCVNDNDKRKKLKLIKCTLEMTNIQSLKNLQEIVNFPTWILLKINI